MASALRIGALFVVFCLPNANAGKYIINAAILGYKNQTNIDVYEAISEITLVDRNADDNYCEIRLREIAYDNESPETVYTSLTNAREAFETGDITVAIGPYIDVFTSPDYVVLDQYHFLTSGNFQHKDVIPILPDTRSLSRAIASIVEKLGWYNVAFLSQDDFSPALELGKVKKSLVWPMRLPNNIMGNGNSELKRMLISLRESRLDKIILHSMKKDVIEEVIFQAQELHLLHHSIEWFVTYMDFKDIELGENWSGSVYGLQLLKEHKLPENITSLPLSQEFSRLDLGVMIDSINLLRHNIWPFAKLFGDCGTEPNGDTVMAPDRLKGMLKKISNPFDGILGRYQWPTEGENARTDYEIKIIKRREIVSEMHKRDTMTETTETIGTVKFENGKKKIELWKSDKRGGKSHQLNTKMVVVTKIDDPFVMEDGNGGYRGFCIDLLNKIAENLNIEIIISDITLNGDVEGSGEIDDMVKELVFGNASIAIGAIPVTAEREETISSSFTILSTDASMLIKKSDNAKNYFQFLGPFSLGLWLTIIGYFFLVALVVFFMSKFDHSERSAEQKFDLQDSIWYALNVLLQGATDYSPQTTSTRTIIAFFWFSVLVINAAYTANLAAYLTLQQIDDRIKNIHDLAAQNSIKYGVRKNSEVSKFFESAREDPYERMWAFMKINEETSIIDPNNSSDIVQMVLGGSYVYIADGVVNKYYEQQYCGVESIGLNFGYKHFGMAFPKGAPYKDDINSQLLILKENGYLDTLKLKWWAPRTNCTGDDASVSVNQRSKTAELQLENMLGVFIILIVCAIIGVCVQIGKFIDKIVKRSNKTKNREKVEPSDSNDVVIRLNPPRESAYTTDYDSVKKETGI